MPKAKPYSGPVKKDIAVRILNSTGKNSEGEPLGDALAAAAERLADLVEQAKGPVLNPIEMRMIDPTRGPGKIKLSNNYYKI